MSRRSLIFLGALVVALVVAIGLAFLPDRDSSETDDSSTGVTPNATPTSSAVDDTDISEGSPAPGTPIATPGRKTYVIWEGPDDAVSSWFSEECNREVLQFGSQQYAPGESASSVPPEVEFMGYGRQDGELWGDRGAPKTLYVTKDGGKTFTSYEATDAQC